jgi:diguanylate cyclase (GGDEF)-like protein/PAS domain S-box-containing protein
MSSKIITYLKKLGRLNTHKLSLRLLIWVILCSSFFAFFVTAFQLYTDYKRDISSIHKSIQFIQDGYLKTLAANAYNMDDQQLNLQLQTILKLNDIEYVEIIEKSNSKNLLLAKQGDENKKHGIHKQFSLTYPSAPKKAAQFSTLNVYASLDNIHQRIWNKALIILFSNISKTLIASVFIFLIFQFLITRHLVMMANFTKQLNIDKLGTPLVLDRAPSPDTKRDELDQLVDSINRMQTKLMNDISERKKATEELSRISELLDNVINASQDLIFVKDTELRTILCNSIFAQALGKKPEDLYGKTDIENGWSEELVKGHPEKGIRGFEADDKEVLTGKTILIEEEPANFNNEIRYFNTIKTPLTDKTGKIIGLLAIARDITEKVQVNKEMAYQASHDSLTGLVNRREFEHRAERLLKTIKTDNSKHALCYMDLDQFKVVNDTCGHIAGDEMLRQLSTLLQSVVRHRDTLARLGGDEFGILMEHCTLDDAKRVAKTLQKAIQDYQFSWEEYSFRVGVSIGLVEISISTMNLTQLLKEADAACYIAKDKGRNRIHIYHSEDEDLAQRHGEMQWVIRINQALEEDRFCLYAQPIISLEGGNNKHYELLVRMVDEKEDIVPPGAFLPAAERYDLITKIDRWVIENSVILLEENITFLDDIDYFAINISGQSLADNSFQTFVINKLRHSTFPPEKICFEITETAAISNLNSAKSFITKMKVLGCQFSLDDFGSGLSSFGYLKNLEVDYLKIDGMFVRDIIDDPIDHAMVKSINDIGQVMGMKTIAEFVENDDIKDVLIDIGVNYAQGYGIDKPKPFDLWLNIFKEKSNVSVIG